MSPKSLRLWLCLKILSFILTACSTCSQAWQSFLHTILSVVKLFIEVFIWLYFFSFAFFPFFFTMYLYLYWILFSYPKRTCITQLCVFLGIHWGDCSYHLWILPGISWHLLWHFLKIFDTFFWLLCLEFCGNHCHWWPFVWECQALEETFDLDFSCCQCISFRIYPLEATLLRLSVTPELRERLFGIWCSCCCLCDLSSMLLLRVQLKNDSLSIHGGSLEVTAH